MSGILSDLEFLKTFKVYTKPWHHIFLSDTGSRKIGEASLRDTSYGIRFPINDRKILEYNTRTGRNELRNLLMEIRESLK